VVLGDLDGDGADEQIINKATSTSTNAPGEVWVVPGDSWSGVNLLEDSTSVTLGTSPTDSVTDLAVVDDLDGDGQPELFVGEGWWADTGNSGDDDTGDWDTGDSGDDDTGDWDTGDSGDDDTSAWDTSDSGDDDTSAWDTGDSGGSDGHAADETSPVRAPPTGDTADDWADTGEGDTGWDTAFLPDVPGRASWLSLDEDGIIDGESSSTVEEAHAWGLDGSDAEAFGYQGVFDDLDGDGSIDAAISAIYDDEEKDYGGSVLVFFDLDAALSADSDDAREVASARVLGSHEEGLLGLRLDSPGDIDQDSVGDLLVSEPGGPLTGVGQVWLLSGAMLDGDIEAEDAALINWVGEDADASTGQGLASGDFDGDGIGDIVISAYTMPTYSSTYGYVETGKVYVYLSSAWGL
jgi:hypothetical protein